MGQARWWGHFWWGNRRVKLREMVLVLGKGAWAFERVLVKEVVRVLPANLVLLLAVPVTTMKCEILYNIVHLFLMIGKVEQIIFLTAHHAWECIFCVGHHCKYTTVHQKHGMIKLNRALEIKCSSFFTTPSMSIWWLLSYCQTHSPLCAWKFCRQWFV